jgi:uncharacterized protein
MTALRLDVADLLARPGARREARIAAPVSGLVGSAARVPEDEPVRLDIVLERIADGIVVRGRLTTRWRADCSQCLTELEHPLELSVGELFEPDPVEGDTYPIEDHEIDLEQLIRDAVLLDLPVAPTCASTGAPACHTPPTRAADPAIPDPRWAALSELEL